MTFTNSKLFESLKIGNLQLKNRLAVAPMTRVSANKDGTVTRLMSDYYQNFAEGGFGLIISEGLYTDLHYSQGYRNQPGIVTAQQMNSWKGLTSSIRSTGAVFIAQLMHAGALSQYNQYAASTSAPSMVQPLGQQMSFYYGEGKYPLPSAMTQDDIKNVILGFVSSAKNAQLAGFSGVEIHGANGYLLDQFLTEYTNKRDDEYGGNLHNRLRIYREILLAVRKAVGNEFIVGVRFSQKKVNDDQYSWSDEESAAQLIFSTMSECNIDYIHTTEPSLLASAFEGSASLASLAKKHSGLPVIANGGVQTPEMALETLKSEQADVVSVGRAALANQDWPNAIIQRRHLKEFNYQMFTPIANLENANCYFQQSRQIPVTE